MYSWPLNTGVYSTNTWTLAITAGHTGPKVYNDGVFEGQLNSDRQPDFYTEEPFLGT